MSFSPFLIFGRPSLAGAVPQRSPSMTPYTISRAPSLSKPLPHERFQNFRHMVEFLEKVQNLDGQAAFQYFDLGQADGLFPDQHATMLSLAALD
ncbi:hypothetical protein OO012_10660 [Rhodobacteraceae bacterium KMM 6894]|nr:hypothetical protein [Rhodobacteraceae bacterium KMM 6894]